MRQTILLVLWTLIGTALIVSGVHLVLPGRNLYGNPRVEHELASCKLADDAEIRLYEGDSVAAKASWYSVTHNPAGPLPERQIIYQFRSPALYDLVCDSLGVVIRTNTEPISLSAEQAFRLREWPRDAQRQSATRWAGGGALVLLGAGLLWMLRPRREDEE
jgi:hypothetical protein